MTRPDTISPPPEVSDLSLHGKQLVGEMIQLLVLSCPAGPIEPTDEYQAARDSLLRYIAGLEADKRAYHDMAEDYALIERHMAQQSTSDWTQIGLNIDCATVRDCARAWLGKVPADSAIDTAQEKPE